MSSAAFVVLGHEGPMLRAYLGALSASGVKPDLILYLVDRRHPATKNTYGRFLPGRLGEAYRQNIQINSHFFWPRRLRKSHAPLIDQVIAWTSETTAFPTAYFDELYGLRPVEELGPTVEKISVDGLVDPSLLERLRDRIPATVLFTGGGLVREPLLSMPGIRILHIHPGLLPHVRGADGLLWSTLVQQKLGASCFYMEAGLDTGDVIETMEFDVPSIDWPAGLTAKEDTIYRVLYSFVDPALRAALLRRIIEQHVNLHELPATPQSKQEGTTYHFMHAALRRRTFQIMFRGWQE